MDHHADAEVKDLVVKDLTVEFTKGDYTVRPLDNLSFTVQAGPNVAELPLCAQLHL